MCDGACLISFVVYKEEADTKKPREKKHDSGGGASAEGAGDDGDADAEADEGMAGEGDEVRIEIVL